MVENRQQDILLCFTQLWARMDVQGSLPGVPGQDQRDLALGSGTIGTY